MSSKTSRQSNIELLRVFAAMGVIILHLNNRNLGGIAGKADRFGLCQFVLVFLGVFAVTAVNVFVLITGYFQARKKKADLYRPLKLILDVLIFAAIFFAAYRIMTGGTYPLSEFVARFIPSNWFILVYSGLYILSPFINKLWNSLKSKEKITLVTAVYLLYSVYPLLIDQLHIEGTTTYGLDGDQRGYNIVNFVLMYLIGCALRDLDENKDEAKKAASKMLRISESSIKSSILPVLLVLNAGMILGMIYLGAYFSGNHPYSSMMFYYNNPLTITLTVLLFLSFKSLKIRDSKVINYVARSAFYVYIIHLHFIRFFNVAAIVIDDALPMLGFMLGMTLMIYLVCFAIFAVYDLTFGKLLNIIAKKWQKRRFIEVE